MKSKVVHSSKNDAWCTPPEIIERVRRIGTIGLDPCADPDEKKWVGYQNFYPPEYDGLDYPWYIPPVREQLIYVNPPYSKVKHWIAKCADEAAKGAEIVALVASRTGTRWFRTVWATAQGLCFLRGRLKFVGAKWAAPFDSLAVYWGPRVDRFHQAFADLGETALVNVKRCDACALARATPGNGKRDVPELQ